MSKNGKGLPLRARQAFSAVVSVSLVAGCASHPDSVEARYVSPTTYQSWSCEQLVDEKKRLTSEVERVSGLQRENANVDAAMMGVGLIVFWPALFALAATKDRKDELGRLKGEHDAVDLSTRQRQCGMTAATAAAPTAKVDATGVYKGSGSASTWCISPTLNLRIDGNDVSGSLSELASGATTSVVRGSVDATGVVTLDFKASNPEFFGGRVDGVIKDSQLVLDLKSKTPRACQYGFALARGV